MNKTYLQIFKQHANTCNKTFFSVKYSKLTVSNLNGFQTMTTVVAAAAAAETTMEQKM